MPKAEIYTDVIIHTHSKMGGKILPPEEARIEGSFQDSSFTLDSLLEASRRITANSGIILCDADHPAHALDLAGVPRKDAYRRINHDPTIRLVISNGILRRAKIVKSFDANGSFMTGVEADILDRDGNLDVTDEALGKLDIVIASFHYSYWELASGDKPALKDYLCAVKKVVSNRNVDILGHPFRDAQGNELRTDVADWTPILEVMKERETAYELNLAYLLSYGLSNEEALVIREGAAKGVNFALGWDFHNFNILGDEFPEGEPIDIDSLDRILRKTKGMPTYRFLRKLLATFAVLDRLGVGKVNIVNSSKEVFLEWLNRR